MARLSLVEFIENLRKKPEHVRITILWTTTAIIMLTVIGIWLISTRGRIQSFLNEDNKLIQEDEQTHTIRDSFRNAFQGLGELRSEIKNLVKGIGEEVSRETEKNKLQVETNTPATTPLLLPVNEE